jgi:hypothetical protein
MQGRAMAIDDLLTSGALHNSSGDEIEEQLRRNAGEQDIARRLEDLKQQAIGAQNSKGDNQ